MPYQSTPEDRQWGYTIGLVYLALAIILAIMLFKIWPPTPWPTDEELTLDQVRARNLAYCECQPTPTPTPATAPAAGPATAPGTTAPGTTAPGTTAPGTTPAVGTTTAPGTTTAARTTTAPGATTAVSTTTAPGATTAASTTTAAGTANAPADNAKQPEKPKSEALVNMPIYIFGKPMCTSFDERLILLVIVASMLGAFVHGATSLADYLGNNRFDQSWNWFYLLRPAIGMALALVFYFAIRGGFLTTTGGAKDINPYGIAALAGMVGMFSKQATDKLGEIFGTLFRSAEGEGDAKRNTPLKPTTAAGTIEKIEPEEVVAGTTNVSIKVTGAGFSEGAKVFLDAKPQETTFDSATSLTAKIPDELTAAPATYKLKVVNAENRESAAVDFRVNPPGGAPDASAATAAPTATEEKPVAGEDGDEDFIDGCDVELKPDTPDEELPITEGGVE